MRSRALSIAVITVASACSLALAFVAGVHIGANESLLLRSTVEATIAVGQLRALRAGKYDELINAKEAELDGHLLLYARLRSDGHPWLLWPYDGMYEHDRYLRSIAIYRTEFPSRFSITAKQSIPESAEEMKAASELLERTTQEIIRTYAK